MRPSRARFSAPDASYRMPWSAACITNTFESEFSVHTGDLAGKLANHLLSKRVRRRPGLDILIRSLSSPEASPVVRQFLQSDFISPLAEKLDEAPTGRIALITAFLAGVAIFRNVLRIAPLLEAEGGELESLIANTIGSISVG